MFWFLVLDENYGFQVHNIKLEALKRMNQVNMRFNLKSLPRFMGSRVNLHLKDGSVLVNVLLTGLRNQGNTNFLDYKVHEQADSKPLQVAVKEIDWMEKVPKELLI